MLRRRIAARCWVVLAVVSELEELEELKLSCASYLQDEMSNAILSQKSLVLCSLSNDRVERDVLG